MKTTRNHKFRHKVSAKIFTKVHIISWEAWMVVNKRKSSNHLLFDKSVMFACYLGSIEDCIFSEMSWVRSIVGFLDFLRIHTVVSSHTFSVCTEHHLHSVWSRLHTVPTVPTHILNIATWIIVFCFRNARIQDFRMH